MLNETVTTVVGNVITDVKQRRITDGTWVASFRVASNERRFDKETQGWVNGDSLYVTVTCWRKLAVGVTASLTKGDPVMVTGRLFTRGYEIEGQKRSVTEIEASAVGPDLSRCVANVTRASRKASEDMAPEAPVEVEMSEDGGDSAGSVTTDSGPLTPVPSQQERRPSGKSERVETGTPQLVSVGGS
jgi:single-strand DNA-binding protein